jgi:hypothetical protein
VNDHPCHCLLCQVPPDEGGWDERDRRIAGKIRQFGWNVNGVAGGSTPDWAYSIGIWHTLRAPEVCVFGLPAQTGMRIVNVVGELIRDGERLHDGQKRDDVLNGYDVVLRSARQQWYRRFFGAGIDFYRQPPLPMVQVIWPDREGRFPWEAEVEESCRRSQPSLWMPPDDHPPGPWTETDPYEGWPFRTSLPYTLVRVSPGAPAIGRVLREPDGSWWFLGAGDDREAAEEAKLRDVTDAHPDVLEVADLRPGERADRNPDGTWERFSTRPAGGSG